MISYIGGKSRMAKWIGEYIPNNIETYVEVFGGAFWVYINGDVHEKPKLKEVIYNDFNRYMANFFECCRTPEEFHKYMIDLKSQDEKLFYKFQKEIFKNKDISKIELGDFEFGEKYAYIMTQVFSGLNAEKAKFIDLKGKYKSKFDSFRGRLMNPKFIKKLRKITKCENLSYEQIIKKYDSSTTYFYVDPPYWKTENYYSLHDFDVEDHKNLCLQLANIKGRFSLSYYEFEKLGEWLPKEKFVWESKDFVKASSASKGRTQNKGTEILVMNYKK
ncbi:MAG: DNA adenine methylase [Flavobacteriales bacterium]|jgi:DNA adenine methylase|nr:DNA adenine methylase [Flavobacteriales bacterium]MDG2059834.1 DNA adenine methylase [Flavobacteriales bacterium]